VCGYNLRDLSRPLCPECRHDLLLTVGVTRPRFLWLLATIAPSVFSGIAAGLLLIPMTLAPLLGGAAAPWPVVATEAFGWLSALAGLLLVRKRWAFLRQSQDAQRLWALGTWAIHVAAFVGLVAVMLVFF
jgi:hypothetical protein